MDRPLVLALVVLSGLATEATGAGEPDPVAPPTVPRCDQERLAKALGIPPRRWFIGCLLLEGTRWAIAAVPLPDLRTTAGRKKGAQLPVWVALAAGADVVWRDQVTIGAAVTPPVREALDNAEDWFVTVERQPLGDGRGVRVGIAGQWGHDNLTVREIALLFRLPDGDGPLRLLWSGAGNQRESRHDYCYIDTFARFRLVDPQTLERQVSVRASLKETGKRPPKRLAQKLRDACVANEPPPERFKIEL